MRTRAPSFGAINTGYSISDFNQLWLLSGGPSQILPNKVRIGSDKHFIQLEIGVSLPLPLFLFENFSIMFVFKPRDFRAGKGHRLFLFKSEGLCA